MARNPKQAEAIEILRSNLPKGSTIYTILRSVSRSGMSRSIAVIHLSVDDKSRIDVRDWTYTASNALGYRFDEDRNGLVIGGAGMDMGFAVAYELGRTLHSDGYAFRHKWL